MFLTFNKPWYARKGLWPDTISEPVSDWRAKKTKSPTPNQTSDNLPMQAFETKKSPTPVKAPPEQHRPFFASAVIQPKLAINQPGDQYEQEAHAMAGRVMRMTSVPRSGDGRCHRQGITLELPY